MDHKVSKLLRPSISPLPGKLLNYVLSVSVPSTFQHTRQCRDLDCYYKAWSVCKNCDLRIN